MKNRLILSLITSALLGLVCILGLSIRMGFEGNEVLIAATWLNRLLMGLVIGLAGSLQLARGQWNPLLRGFLLGLLVSFSLYIATDFIDTVGFFAGIAYGVIIDWVATKYSK